MSSKFGMEFRLNEYVTTPVPAYYNLGGHCKPVRPQAIGREMTEEGTGTRKLAELDLAELRFVLETTIVTQQIEGYIAGHLFPTDEGPVPEHVLRYTDGIEKKEMTGVKCSKGAISIRHGGFVATDLTLVAKDIEDFVDASPAWEILDIRPMSFRDVQGLFIDTVEVTNWKDIAFSIDNHLEELSLGTDLGPTDIGEGLADYKFEVTLSRKIASYLDDIKAGALVDCQFNLDTHQTPGRRAIFSLKDCLYTLHRLEVPGLGSMAEKVELKPWKLELTFQDI